MYRLCVWIVVFALLDIDTTNERKQHLTTTLTTLSLQNDPTIY